MTLERCGMEADFEMRPGGSSGAFGWGAHRGRFPCRGAAVAATNAPRDGAICNRRDALRDLDARGWWCLNARAATSVRRAGVKHSCAFGYRGWQADVKGRMRNCACGRRVLLVAARNLAILPLRGWITR